MNYAIYGVNGQGNQFTVKKKKKSFPGYCYVWYKLAENKIIGEHVSCTMYTDGKISFHQCLSVSFVLSPENCFSVEKRIDIFAVHFSLKKTTTLCAVKDFMTASPEGNNAEADLRELQFRPHLNLRIRLPTKKQNKKLMPRKRKNKT